MITECPRRIIQLERRSALLHSHGTGTPRHLGVRMRWLLCMAAAVTVCAAVTGPVRGDAGTLSRAAFTEFFVLRFQQRYPGAQISVRPDGTISYSFMGQSERTAFLDNAFASYLAQPSSLDAVLDRYVRVSADSSVVGGEIDIGRLMPCTRGGDRAQFPPDPEGLASEAIAGDLVVHYCLDMDTFISYAHPEQMRDLIGRHPDFRERAVHNIDRIARPPEFTLGNGRAMVVNGGDYETSLVLDDRVWQQLHAHLGETIVFGVPTRDLFVSVDGSDLNQVAWLRAQVERYYERGPYPVSNRLYRHTRHEITVFD